MRLMLLLSLSLACSGPGGRDDPDLVASIELTPRNLLLLGEGDSFPLRAVPLDADGLPLDVQVSWEIDQPGIISISEEGVATALAEVGSTYVRAFVGDVRSNYAFVFPARLQPGVLVLTDAQILGEPTLVDPAADIIATEDALPFVVQVSDDVVAEVGRPMLAREDALVLGRVLAINEGGIEYEDAPLSAFFVDLDIETDQRSVPGATGSSVDALDFEVGPFSCTTEHDTPIELRDTTQTLRFGAPLFNAPLVMENGEVVSARLEIALPASAELGGTLAVPDPLNAKLSCYAELVTVPIPVGGEVSKIAGIFVEGGLGFELEGVVRNVDLGVTLSTRIDTTLRAGFEYHRETGFTLLGETTETTDTSTIEVGAPDPETIEIGTTFFGYGQVSVKVGLPWLPSVSIQHDIVRYGAREHVDVRPLGTGQLDAPDFAASYRVEALTKTIPGVFGGRWLVDRLFQAIDVDPTFLDTEVAAPLSRSPTGELDFSATAVGVGEMVTATVTLDPETTSYLGFDNVAEVNLWRRGDEGWMLMHSWPGAGDSYTFDWVPLGADVGANEFAATVVTNRLAGVELEVAADSRQTVTVACGSPVRVEERALDPSGLTLYEFGTPGGGGGVSSHAQTPSGGNPGEFLTIDLTVFPAIPGGPTHQGVTAVLAVNGSVYHPATQGAIESVDITMDGIHLDADVGEPRQFGTAALIQDGRVYYALASKLEVAETEWTTYEHTALRADDFRTDAPVFHPDFSASGSPITFGFWRAATHSLGSPMYTVTAGVDNWSVTVAPACPE